MASKEWKPAAASLYAVWDGSNIDTVDNSECSDGPLTDSDVVNFANSLESHVEAWSALFNRVPSDHQRRKEALGGALKIKAAGKRLAKARTTLADSESTAQADNQANAEEGNSEAAAASGGGNAQLPEAITECQSAFQEIVLGLLETSFPVDELVRNSDYKDEDGLSETLKRMALMPELTWALGKLFTKGSLKPKSMAISGKDDPMAPQLLKMLEKQMKKQKKKDKKKGGKGYSAEQSQQHIVDVNAAKAAWEHTVVGQCSAILGEEVWEGMNWRRGIFLYDYIRILLDEPEHGTTPKEDAIKDAGSEILTKVCAVSRPLFTDAMRSFHNMLLARGAVISDLDDPAEWQTSSDGCHDDETGRMYYHGIYTSTHLRALKHLAELAYWQWKHNGKTKVDAVLAALLNRKFAHIINNIMPHAGWTAIIEGDRVLEVEKHSLQSE